MSHQDWTPAVIYKKKTKEDSIRAGETAIVEKHRGASTRKAVAEPGALPEIVRADLSIKQHIVAGRLAKKWTQQMLANECSMSVSVIQSYENGTAIAKPVELQKICRKLGIAQPAIPKPKSTST